MKKSLIVLFILFYSSSIFGQSGSFSVSFNIEDFEINRSAEYSYFDLQKSNLYYKTTPGTPAVPYLPVNFAVPYGSEFIEISVSFDTVLIAEEIVLQPMQRAVPIGVKKKERIKVGPLSDIYNSSQPFPREQVQFTSSQQMSCYQFFTFDVSPLMYLPVEKRLYLVTDLTVNVAYTSGQNTNAGNRFDDGTFYGMLKEEVINSEDLQANIRNRGAEDECQYLIITSNSLKESFQPLAEWKNQTGVTTEIVSVEDIYAKHHFHSHQMAIKKFIHDYYQHKGTLFFLLGGDLEVVPVQRCIGKSEDDDEGDNTMPADLFFACFDATFDWDFNNNKIFGEVEDNIDMAPEVFITRATVQSPAHATTFVNKILNYEQNPPLTGFANEMVNFGVQVFNSYDGRNDAAWLTDRMFEGYVDPYWNGTHYSFYAMDSTGTSYNINDSLITSEIEKGYNFLFNASHGYPDSWRTEGAPFFTIENAYELSNEDQQGIFVTIACMTNAFDDFVFFDISSGYPILYDSCLSETFLRNPTGGAVGYHGSSRYGWGLAEPIPDLGPSFLYSAYFFQGLFSGQPHINKYKLGAVAAKAKLHLIGASSEYGVYRWLQFTLNTLGDAEMDIYTNDPVQLTLECPDTVNLGNNDLITIETGIPYTGLCIQNGNGIYIVATTDATGGLTFTPQPVSYDPLIVTATFHNMVYAVDTIKVGPPEGPVVIVDDHSFNAGDDQIINHCDCVTVDVTLKNIGVDTAFSTLLFVECPDDFIAIIDNDVSFGDIPPGESRTIEDAYSYEVICHVPDDYSFDIQAKILCDLSELNTKMSFVAYAPVIEVAHIFVQSGDYHFIRPNDSTDIFVDIRNNGGATANNFNAYLTSDGGSIFIYKYADTNHTVLNPGEEASLHFGVHNTETVGTEIFFLLDMTADYFLANHAFQLQVIDSIENFETGDFTLYPWDISQGDSEWVIDTVNAFNGRFCAKSGVLEKWHRSILEIEVDVLSYDGVISFYKKTSPLILINHLKFYIDSVLMGSWPGYINWSKETFPVGPGLHTFTWEYAKTLPVIVDTADCVWIDYICFPDFSITGVEDDLDGMDDDRVFIYPNPNNGTFNLLSRNGLPENTVVEIFNIQGQVIYRKGLPTMLKNSTVLINPGDLFPGIYVMKITGDQFVISRKLLIN
ncbi:MAG: T9SS type A sorting domain-containing protein [Bacteroidales bacterium]|nr:T9SS type A sorting domain-containing protein [Bacteroidales bacterium]